MSNVGSSHWREPYPEPATLLYLYNCWLTVMHKWACVMAVSLNYCTPLHLGLKFWNRFNRRRQENDKIKFWKSVPSYVLVRKYQWRKKIIFNPSNKWENLNNVLFYRQQIAYTSPTGDRWSSWKENHHLIICTFSVWSPAVCTRKQDNSPQRLLAPRQLNLWQLTERQLADTTIHPTVFFSPTTDSPTRPLTDTISHRQN